MAFRFTPPCCCDKCVTCESLVGQGVSLPCSGVVAFDDLDAYIKSQSGEDCQYGYAKIIGVTDSTDGISAYPPDGGYFPMRFNCEQQRTTFFKDGTTDEARLSSIYNDNEYFLNRREYEVYVGAKYGLSPRVYGIWKKCAIPTDGQDYNLIIYDGDLTLQGILGEPFLAIHSASGRTAIPTGIYYTSSHRPTYLNDSGVGGRDRFQQAEYYLNQNWDIVDYISWVRFPEIHAAYTVSGLQGLACSTLYDADNVPGFLAADIWSTRAPRFATAPNGVRLETVSAYVSANTGTVLDDRTFAYSDYYEFIYSRSLTATDNIYKTSGSSVSDLLNPILPNNNIQDAYTDLRSIVLDDIVVSRHYEALYC